MKILRKLLRIIIAIYLIIVSFFYLKQKDLLYHPSNTDFFSCESFSGFEMKIYGDTRFYVLDRGKETLVYFHGNAGTACDRKEVKDWLVNATSFTLIFVEYGGYAGDTQAPSKKIILSDAENIASYMKENEYIGYLIRGSSIGSGPASYLTALIKTQKLILFTPLYSIKSIIHKKLPFIPTILLLQEDFDNSEYLQDFPGNTLLVHGTHDRTIPYSETEKLHELLNKTTTKLIRINEGDHNNIFTSEVKQHIQRFIEQ